MKRGVVKVTACCLAGSVIFASTGLTAFAAGEMPLAGIGAEIIASQEKKENSETKKVIATGYDSLVIAQVDEYVNIRDEASTETGQIVGKLYNNSAAEIIGQTGDWYLIKSGDVTGYVSKDYFVTGAQAEELAAEVGDDVATVNTETLMVRKKASTDSDVIALVGDSQQLQVIDQEDGWVKVAVDNDVVGYVSSDYVDCETKFVEAESIETSTAREEAVQSALDRADQMKEAAINAMNNADANEAAYAAQEAIVAAAEAKQLASEQELDYNVQEIASTAVSSADEAQYAAYMAEQYQAAAAEAQAAAEAEAARQQAEAEAAYAAQQQAQASQQQNQNWTGDQTQQETQAPSTTTDTTTTPDYTTGDTTTTPDYTTGDATTTPDYSTGDVTVTPDYGTGDTTTTPDYTTGDTTGSTTTDSSAPSGSDYTGDVPQSNASSSDSLRQSVVNYALQFVGNPYVYGGTSLTNGTDCSGFTQSVLANFGISISRTAASQSGGGTAVDMSNLQPGDLLFYDNGSGIGHVSMYIGNGQVVHASNEQTGIIVSSVDYRTACAARSYF